MSVLWCILCRGLWPILILPSVFLAPFFQSLMWRIGGWVEGQVLPPPRSPLTCYCPIQWLWYFRISFEFHLVVNIIFWAAIIIIIIMVIFFFTFALIFGVSFILRTLTPHLCFIKYNFSSNGKIYCPYFHSPHSFTIASPVLLFAWRSASFEQRLSDQVNNNSPCL